VEEAARKLGERLTAVETRLTQVKSESPQDVLNFPPQLDNQLVALLGGVSGGQAPPTDGARVRFDELREELNGLLTELQGALDSELVAFNALVGGKGLGAVVVVPR
jgi:hypothetical protein